MPLTFNLFRILLFCYQLMTTCRFNEIIISKPKLLFYTKAAL